MILCFYLNHVELSFYGFPYCDIILSLSAESSVLYHSALPEKSFSFSSGFSDLYHSAVFCFCAEFSELNHSALLCFCAVSSDLYQIALLNKQICCIEIYSYRLY